MRLLVALAVLAALAGCSSKPVAPVITSVTGPMTASAGDSIQLVILFDDPDSAVTGMRVVYPATAESVVKSFQPLFTGDAINFGIKFPLNTPFGPFETDLSLIDDSGLEGPAKQVMVTIQ